MPGGGRAWIVTGRQVANRVFTDPRFSNDPSHRAGSEPITDGRHMGIADPPDHRRLRGVIARVFTPAALRQHRGTITDLADQVIAALPAHTDLVTDFAAVLPLRVMFTLLGIRTEHHGELIADLTRVSELSGRGDEAAGAMRRVRDRLDAETRHRDRHRADDVLSALAAAVDAGNITAAERDSTVLLLVGAGHETTVNLLAVSLYWLLREPQRLRRLADHLDTVPTAVAELVRHDPIAVHSTGRYTTERVDLAGTTIPAGELVLVNLAAVNRDPEGIAEPDRLMLDREPVAHHAFGHGPHICLGKWLTLMETEIAITRLLAHHRDIMPTVPLRDLEWKQNHAIRGLRRLPVRLGDPR